MLKQTNRLYATCVGVGSQTTQIMDQEEVSRLQLRDVSTHSLRS